MVSPEEVERIEVLYGPFSAAYPGNSIGAVVNITTRMPDHLEASVTTQGAWQSFRQYGTRGDYGAGRVAAVLGDRIGRLSFWLSANHLVADSQPLAFVTASPASPRSTGGVAAAGSIAGVNRLGLPVQVVGAGGLERQVQDTVKLKLAYALTPTLTGAYTLGWFGHRDRASVESYLRDGAGAPVYTGSLDLGGLAYSVAAGAFDNNLYRLAQDQWMQSLTLATHTGGTWDVAAVASLYTFGRDLQRNPTTALPAAFAGGPGTITSMGGTGWRTLDLNGQWRPLGMDGPHRLSGGLHLDGFRLHDPKWATADWLTGGKTILASLARGRTDTAAVWAEDAWRLAPALEATLGLRWERWRAHDGLNYSASPALSAAQPRLSAWRASPKAALTWKPAKGWMLKAAFGEAYRFPTVAELYQAVTTGPVLSVPDPDLRPERARSGELSVERRTGMGVVRASLFAEAVEDALISQSGALNGAAVNFVQNVERVRSRGAEIALERLTVGERLELSGSVTYVDSRIAADSAVPVAVGKRTPQVPRWRASATATWRATDRLALTLGARYSDRVYATIDNSDLVGHAWQGFDGYFVVDARARFRIDRRWTAALGVENLNNDRYFLFHPFPQRTVVAELKWAL
jgi:iron complex outermembrane receptor protein